MNKNITLIYGDCSSPEIVTQAVRVLDKIAARHGHTFTYTRAYMGGEAIDRFGDPLPASELEKCKSSDSVLLGAIGGPKWEGLPGDQRPEKGLLRLRAGMGLYANNRPAKIWPQLADASPLKKSIVDQGIDFIVVRELIGGVYFGEHKTIEQNGEKVAIDTMPYSEHEIERIGRIGFETARKRQKKLTCVDKANVLESSRLWRRVVTEVAKDYPEVTLDHLYVDNAATTPVSKPVFDAMAPYFCEQYGNPSSIFYSVGAAAGDALAAAREKVARALGCDTGEVFFTSCGSEADNWAIKGTAHKFAKQGKKHLITSCIEHHAVLHSMQALEREGFEVTYLPVDAEGFVSPADVEAAIRPDTALVTIMFANNEIGTIEPIEEIGAVCRKHGVWFHTDAVQAVGAVPIDCHALPVDMLSLSAHKFNGPKGVGALYIRRGVMPLNFLDGGAQERGRRAGTENLAGIVGLATALEAAVNSLDEKRARLARMRDYVLEHIQKMPQVKVNGPLDGSKRLPNNVNASFTAAEGESLLLMLDMRGVCASSGSACASGSLDPSHVLLSIGLPHEIAHCSLRISFGVQNTIDDAKAVCDALDEVVPAVRQRSPLWRA